MARMEKMDSPEITPDTRADSYVSYNHERSPNGEFGFHHNGIDMLMDRDTFAQLVMCGKYALQGEQSVYEPDEVLEK